MLARGGACNFPVAPHLRATETPVFWLPSIDTGSVVLAPQPPPLGKSAGQVSLAGKIDLQAEDGTHVLKTLGDGQRLHLVLPHDVNRHSAPVAVVPLDLQGFDRLDAVARLLAFLHGRRPHPDTRLTSQQRARAKRMLQAFDGRQEGATQQTIAEIIFRTGKLSRDEWQAASARHAVMSLLRSARTMISGGYRNLLRHRRRK